MFASLSYQTLNGVKVLILSQSGVTIETEYDTPLASIDLLMKECVFFSEVGKTYSYEPHIDYDLLRSKQIYLLGKLLTF